MQSLVRDLLLAIAGAALVGALAQLAIRLPGTVVPMTGQTLGVLLVGSALGRRRAASALLLYMGAGVAGAPWFAGHTSGYASASFGYVLGFLLAAVSCGWAADRGLTRRVWSMVPVLLVAEVLIYGCGVTWLAVDLHVGFTSAFAMGVTPFLIGDALKAALAVTLVPAASRLVSRTSETLRGEPR